MIKLLLAFLLNRRGEKTTAAGLMIAVMGLVLLLTLPTVLDAPDLSDLLRDGIKIGYGVILAGVLLMLYPERGGRRP